MSLLNWIYPRRCLCCRCLLDGPSQMGVDVCLSCEKGWRSLEVPYCDRCARPFQTPSQSHLCGECLVEQKVVHKVYAFALYQGVLLELIRRMKYRGEEWLGPLLGKWMASALLKLPHTPYHLIIPIPMTVKDLRRRGYNQSLLIGRGIAGTAGGRLHSFLLMKTRETVHQVALSGEERRRNLRGAFRLKEGSVVKGKKILLVDDVYTTGATLEEAGRTLLKAGALQVDAAVLARAL